MPARNTEGIRVFRPTYRARDGSRGRSPVHHVAFRHDGAWRRLIAFTDRAASIAFGRRVRQLADLAAAGTRPDAELARWVDSLQDEHRERLTAWGILDRRLSMAAVTLQDHVEAWHRSIVLAGRTARHAALHRRRVESIVQGCAFGRFADIDRLAVEEHLAGLGATTRNHYARAFKQFCRWMAETGRGAASPVAGLKMRPTATDRRRVRRSLTLAELQRLIDAAEAGPVRGRMSGAARGLVYRLAAETGFRAGELRSLTRASFALDAERPTVTVAAAYAKNRRQDTLALSAGLALRLRCYLAPKLPAAPAFALPRRTADMLRADLAAAGLPYRDDAGAVFDFHALRVQCATDLARGGALPAEAQRRLRHSTSALTMDVYTRLGLAERQDAALAALPKLA
jgi:integrase